MNKKSQLTLFIIIGIILVFSAAIIIYIQQQVETAGFEEDRLSSLAVESQPVKLFVDRCLEDVAIPGIYYMGTQGGYIAPPLNSLITETSIIPYYYARGSNEMPPLVRLENEISEYVETTLPICTNNFETFPQEIEEGEIRATTRINEQNILIKVFYPLTIKNLQGKEEKIENFVIDVPIRLGHIYDVAQQVVERQIEQPDLLDLTYLASFDVNVDILPYDGTSIIFAITDSRSKIEGVNYQLFFARFT